VIESYPDIPERTWWYACGAELVYTGDLLANGWYPACLDGKATVFRVARDAEGPLRRGTRTRCSCRAWATLRAARYRHGARALDDIAEQAGKMFKAACRLRRHSTGMSYRRDSRTSLCFPGIYHRCGDREALRRVAGKEIGTRRHRGSLRHAIAHTRPETKGRHNASLP